MLTQVKAEKVGRFVNTKHVESLISNYKKERWIQNSKRIDKADSLSVWYSLSELQEFLETANENGADGIKICFGVYDKETAKEPLYEGRQTVVFVATKTSVAQDGETFNKSVYVKKEEGEQILAYNMANPCPPYGSGNGFDWDGLGVTIVDGTDGMQII